MRQLYSIALYLLVPFVLIRLLWRARRQPAYLKHLGERFGSYALPSAKKVIWLHAVSVGEARAAQPLVVALLKTYPQHPIVLTYMTPTGRQTGVELFGRSVVHAYLPYDLPGSTERFLNHFSPSLGVLLETEIWPNLINNCKRRSLPLILANARLSQKSLQKYQRFAPLIGAAVRNLSTIAAQTSEDARRFTTLGATAVVTTGNLKFDINPPAADLLMGATWRAQWSGQRPVFLVASSRDGEEALILSTLRQVNIPHLLTVITPRHPQRFTEVATLINTHGFTYQRRSLNSIAGPEIDIILGDSMGEMFAYYAACDVAFIGGSLLPFGGQNLIEACAVGKPVLLGPHTYNFSQASENAIASGAAQRVANAQELAQSVELLLKNPARRNNMSEAALNFAAEYQGATAKVMKLIKNYLD